MNLTLGMFSQIINQLRDIHIYTHIHTLTCFLLVTSESLCAKEFCTYLQYSCYYTASTVCVSPTGLSVFHKDQILLIIVISGVSTGMAHRCPITFIEY